ETARTVVLVERVPHRGDAVVHRVREDAVPVALEWLPRAHLHELELVREPPEDAPQAGEELAQPRRAVHGERELALPELERLEHPREAEVVVAVVVRDEDLIEVGQADRRAHQLPLRALAAIEEQPITPTPDEQRRRGAGGGRGAARRAEKDEIEVHAPILAQGERARRFEALR